MIKSGIKILELTSSSTMNPTV